MFTKWVFRNEQKLTLLSFIGLVIGIVLHLSLIHI